MARTRVPFLLLAAVAIFLACAAYEDASAIPAFARKYQTSCATCHYAFPRLNAFGKAFKNNGYRYPGGDEDYRKDNPVSIGAESYKKVWPEALWPSDISGAPPLSVHMIQRTNIAPDGEPEIEFEFPHEFELLMGGTIGETFSYFGELELEHEDELAYEFFLQYDPIPELHVRAGAIDPMPIQEHARLTSAHYNYGSLRTISGGWRMRSGNAGLEMNGALNGPQNKGGFRYAFGVANGLGEEGANENNNGVNDIYWRASYKVGGMGELGGAEAEGSETVEFWRDNNVKVGTFGYWGTSDYGADENAYENEFTVVGVEGEWWWQDLIVFGAFLNQKDDNVDGDNTEITSQAWFVEGNYVVYPWLIPLARYEWTRRDVDEVIGANEAVEMLVPGANVMLRANVKLIAEGQIRIDDAGEGMDKYVLAMQWGF